VKDLNYPRSCKFQKGSWTLTPLSTNTDGKVTNCEISQKTCRIYILAFGRKAAELYNILTPNKSVYFPAPVSYILIDTIKV